MASDEELVQALQSMHKSVEGVREDMAEEGRKRDIRIRTNRIATFAAVGAAIIGVVVASVGISDVHAANSERNARTIAACQQSNIAVLRGAVKDEKNFDDFIDVLVAEARNTGRPAVDPALIRRVKLAEHLKIEAEAHRSFDHGGLYRDCSPAGIARFYSAKS